MTAQRQERYGRNTGPHFRPGIALILLACLWGLNTASFTALRSAAGAATTERVVTNRFSGLAIEGYDPVAYFTDARPLPGLPDFEASQDGAVWRFRNEGNRASFVAHPEVYAPQFGGYDPVDVARGVAVAGSPLFWLVSGQRLYLFGREETRDAFAADPERVLKSAEERWPALENTLAQ